MHCIYLTMTMYVVFFTLNFLEQYKNALKFQL